MFLIFFNDFPLVLKHSKAIMYADDTVVYLSGKVKEDVERLLNEDLTEISNYFDQNELFVNLKKGKTESMILGTAKRLKTAGNNLNVCYKGQMINNVTEYKYLGNIVDQNLNFNKNLNRSTRKRVVD